jgi:hypothetical protein
MCLSFKLLSPIMIAPVIGGIATADLTGSGRQDLIVTAPAKNEIIVLVPSASGSFTKAKTFPAGKNPVAVTMAVLDSSSRPDAIVAGGTAGTVTILPNNGHGGFGKATSTFKQLSNAVATGAADFRDQGLNDILVVENGSDNVAAFTNTGRGFTGPTNIPVGTGPTALAIADFNADSYPDFVTADAAGNTASLVLDDPAGGFQTARKLPVGTDPVAVLAPSLDAYTPPWIVTANKADNTISVLPNTGGSQFPDRWDWPVGTMPVALAAGDLVGNGTQTLVIANAGSDSLTLFACDVTGGFIATETIKLAATPANLALADTNADGAIDIIVSFTNGTAQVLLNQPGTRLYNARLRFAAAANRGAYLSGGTRVSLAGR